MKIQRTKLLLILIGFLLLLNITTIATVWFTRPTKGMSAEIQAGPKNFLIKKLRFDDEQAHEFEVLFEEHIEQMRGLRKQIADDKEELLVQITAEQPDTALAYQLMAAISASEEKAEKFTFSHFRKVREICTPEQKMKFDLLIGDIFKNMIGASHGNQRTPASPPPGGPPLP
jgi:protein CpxP